MVFKNMSPQDLQSVTSLGGTTTNAVSFNNGATISGNSSGGALLQVTDNNAGAYAHILSFFAPSAYSGTLMSFGTSATRCSSWTWDNATGRMTYQTYGNSFPFEFQGSYCVFGPDLASTFLDHPTGATSAGVEYARFLNSARSLGIGTTAPTAAFQVSRSANVQGTVAVSGTDVTGVGTKFLNTFRRGDTITVVTTSGSETKTITTITSDTVLVTDAFTGTAAAGTAYAVVPGVKFSVYSSGKVESVGRVVIGTDIFGTSNPPALSIVMPADGYGGSFKNVMLMGGYKSDTTNVYNNVNFGLLQLTNTANNYAMYTCYNATQIDVSHFGTRITGHGSIGANSGDFFIATSNLALPSTSFITTSAKKTAIGFLQTAPGQPNIEPTCGLSIVDPADNGLLTVSGKSNFTGATSSIEFNYNKGVGGNTGNITKIVSTVEDGGGGNFQFQTAPSVSAAYATQLSISRYGQITIQNGSLVFNGTVPTISNVMGYYGKAGTALGIALPTNSATNDAGKGILISSDWGGSLSTGGDGGSIELRAGMASGTAAHTGGFVTLSVGVGTGATSLGADVLTDGELDVWTNSYGSDVLTDGAFDAWTAGALDSWTAWNPASGPAYVEEATIVHTGGGKAVKFATDGSGNSAMPYQQVTGLTENDILTLSFEMAGATGTGEEISVLYFDANPTTGKAYNFVDGTWDTLGGPPGANNKKTFTLSGAGINTYVNQTVQDVPVSATGNIWVVFASGGASKTTYLDDATFKVNSATLTNWLDGDGGGTAGGSLIKESAIVHSGSYSAKMFCPSTGGTRYIAQSEALTAGDNYRAKLWAIGIVGGETARLLLLNGALGVATQVYNFSTLAWVNGTGAGGVVDPSGDIQDDNFSEQTMTSAWSQLTFADAVVPVNNTVVAIFMLKDDGITAKTAYFDLLSYQKVTQAAGTPGSIIFNEFGNTATVFGQISRLAGTQTPMIMNAEPDSASAIGLVIGSTYEYTTAGSKLLSVVNGLGTVKVEKFLVDKDGSTQGQGRILGKKGADVTAANDMTLILGNYFDITGATECQRILGTGWTAGSIITLQFDAAPLVKHGTAAGTGYFGFKLAGASDFQASADDTLTLVFDGAWFREIARSVI